MPSDTADDRHDGGRWNCPPTGIGEPKPSWTEGTPMVATNYNALTCARTGAEADTIAAPARVRAAGGNE